MSTNSTSLINFSGDKKLNFLQAILWLFGNILNNFFPNINIDKRIKNLKFKFVSRDLKYLDENKYLSPSRYLCDLFWLNFPFDKIETKDPLELKICEVGCGTGVYPKLLQKIIGKNKLHYTGIDIKKYPEWENFDNKNFKFIIDKSDNIKNYLQNIDLLFTQSAIEHFEKDLLFFKNISNYVSSTKKPLLQIHLLPSHKCLFNFLNHGFRQYSLRNISKFTKLFDNNSNIYIYKLEGFKANTIHRQFITYPRILKLKDKRLSKNNEYLRIIKKVLNQKLNNKQLTFYALVISSNQNLNLN